MRMTYSYHTPWVFCIFHYFLLTLLFIFLKTENGNIVPARATIKVIYSYIHTYYT